MNGTTRSILIGRNLDRLFPNEPLVCTENWVKIFSDYTQAIEHFMRESGVDEPTIEKVWFSDTFILFSPDDKDRSFCAIESAARRFVDSLVSRGIPIRGAISCADLYADKKNSLFFGKRS